jgi:hypothetical protein
LGPGQVTRERRPATCAEETLARSHCATAWRTAHTNVTLRARVTMPELHGVDLNGASTLRFALAGEDVEIDMGSTVN